MLNGKYSSVFLLIAISFSFVSEAFPQISNPSFESYESAGDFNTPVDWNHINYTAVLQSFMPLDEFRGHQITWPYKPVLPKDANHFVLLSTAEITPEPSYARMSQTITFAPGGKLQGFYFFGTYDYVPFVDYATIKLIAPPQSGLTDVNIIRVSVEDVGDFNSTDGWQFFEHNFNQQNAGIYELEFYVADVNDAIYPSYFAVDGLSVCIQTKYGNINDDCIVNFGDFAILASYWQLICSDPNWCSGADFDESGLIDYNDLKVIVNNWLL